MFQRMRDLGFDLLALHVRASRVTETDLMSLVSTPIT